MTGCCVGRLLWRIPVPVGWKLGTTPVWSSASCPDYWRLSARLHVCKEIQSDSRAPFYLFCERSLPVALRDDVRFPQHVLDNSLVKAQMPYEMSSSTASEARLYSHAVVLISWEVGKQTRTLLKIRRMPLKEEWWFSLYRRHQMRSHIFNCSD